MERLSIRAAREGLAHPAEKPAGDNNNYPRITPGGLTVEDVCRVLGFSTDEDIAALGREVRASAQPGVAK